MSNTTCMCMQETFKMTILDPADFDFGFDFDFDFDSDHTHDYDWPEDIA